MQHPGPTFTAELNTKGVGHTHRHGGEQFTLSSSVLSVSFKGVSGAKPTVEGPGCKRGANRKTQVSFAAALTITSQSAQFVCASAGEKKAMQETEGGKIKATAQD